MIYTRNIQKVFRRGEQVRYALQNVNIDIEEGAYVIVSGPSGSGKTTLLGLLGLVDPPTGGEIYFRGEEVGHLPEKQREILRRNHIAFIFEQIHLIDELTVFENIELPLLYLSTKRRQRKEIVETLLRRYRLNHLRNQYPLQLGDFVQQKVALARACSCSPAVVFADEPAGRLNSSESEELMGLLGEINEEGITLILATHSANEARHGQRIIQLNDGHVVSSS